MDAARLLQRLPPREAQALVLAAHGFTEREGAAILGITQNTFRAYRRDGRRRSKEIEQRHEQVGGSQ